VQPSTRAGYPHRNEPIAASQRRSLFAPRMIIPKNNAFPTAPEGGYRPDIDGLRAIAVLAVIFHHFHPSALPGGYVGVDVFFVISGYLITRIIGQEIEQGRFSFRRFYLRRVRRLLPALFAVLAFVMVVGWFLLLPVDYVSTLKAAAGTVLFGSNFVFWRELGEGYFASDAKLNPLLHTWSLAVEEQFYLIYPVLLLLGIQLFREQLRTFLFLTLLLSLAASAFFVRSDPVAVFFLSPYRAWELLAGALLATARLPAVRNTWGFNLLGVAGLTAILLPAFIYAPEKTFPGLAALPPVLGAAALIYLGYNRNVVVTRLLSFRAMVFTGLISYSLYLWHWPLIVFARFVTPAPLSSGEMAILLVFSFLLAWLSYRFVETPFRTRMKSKWIVSGLAVSGAILLIAGTAGIVQQGYKQRFSASVIAFDQARTPHIPYRGCHVTETCILGDQTVRPVIALWGDSHMLAWAPGIDQVLEKNGKSAYLFYTPACPPLLGVEVTRKSNCRARNEMVKQAILEEEDIHTVILSARWGLNFDNPQWFVPKQGVNIATPLEDGLLNTVTALEEMAKQVVVVGPVPVWETHVPMMIARNLAYGWPMERQSREQHHSSHLEFYTLIQGLADTRPGVAFVDPSESMCEVECEIYDGTTPYYRDEHHLSIEGAHRYAPAVFSTLAIPEPGPRDLRPRGRNPQPQ